MTEAIGVGIVVGLTAVALGLFVVAGAILDEFSEFRRTYPKAQETQVAERRDGYTAEEIERLKSLILGTERHSDHFGGEGE